MSNSLSTSQIINIAVGIERTGIAFYDTMSRSVKDAQTRDAFQYLAAMEREHIRIFQNMLSEADKDKSSEAPPEEYSDYLQELVDNAVFTDDMITGEMAMQADSDIKALELAIGAEKDSMLFYYEMKEVMTRRAQTMISKIIAEERSHLRQLSGLKKKLTTT